MCGLVFNALTTSLSILSMYIASSIYSKASANFCLSLYKTVKIVSPSFTLSPTFLANSNPTE